MISGKKNLLVLTDHKTHRDGESFYSFLNAVRRSNFCGQMYVASRGWPINDGFFCNAGGAIHGRNLVEDIDYAEDGGWFQGSIFEIDLSNIDVIFLRLDRPVSDTFLRNLKIRFADKLIINDPEGIIKTGAKSFLLSFPDLVPGICSIRNIDDINNRLQKGDIVIKPMYGYGGQGIIRSNKDYFYFGDEQVNYDLGSKRISEILSHSGPMIAMDYLDTIGQGDKRIVVVYGEVVGAILRFPKDGSWLANLSAGGFSRAADVSEEEIEIIHKLDPILSENGIAIYGIDTLVGKHGLRVLSEINTLNVGGIFEIGMHSNKSAVDIAVAAFWRYVHDKS